MSHTRYQTRALVLGVYPSGEASALVQLFTRELGMVTAVAQGLRENKSKLRSHLQTYSISEVSLVRGKEWWRIVGAEGGELPKNHHIFITVARVASLLKQLVHGEEKSERLFDDLDQGFRFAKEVGSEELKALGNILTIKILYQLGYLRPDKVVEPYVSLQEWSVPALQAATRLEHEFTAHVALSLTNANL